jgi:acyl-CoA dehydrogenase
MIPRKVYDEDCEIFRDAVRKFIEREIAPHHDQWEKDGQISREAWRKAGEAGLLCPTMPEEYGGAGADFRYSAVIIEELAHANCSGPGYALHSDIVAPYILHYGTEEQKKAWLPRLASGEAVGAIAMTDPSAGSDLQGVKTRAVLDGDEWVINGSKTFITNGQHADLVILVCKTDPAQGAKGTSLIVVEGDRAGFTKGRNLEKIGMKAQDTSELFFDDCRVPRDNLLGGENQGFIYLMQELPQERLIVALGAVESAAAALQWTIDYTRERKAFGRSVAEFQNTRFTLAEMKTKVEVTRAFVDRCLELHVDGKLTVEDAAMAKYWASEVQFEVLDACLQLHGGYGYMWEYPIARAWADARVQRIYAGTSEIMKELISRAL